MARLLGNKTVHLFARRPTVILPNSRTSSGACRSAQHAALGIGRALLERQTIHIPDIQADPDYTLGAAKELGGVWTILAVPMLRDGTAIGVLALTRRAR